MLNYTKLDKGFTHQIKKGVPFHWDNETQKAFDALKDVMIKESILYPLDYQHDYFL